MTNKVPDYAFNYSIKYQVESVAVRQAQAKPKMLSIASIPDDNTVQMEYLDHRGIVFKQTGNFDLPEFDEVERENLVLGGLSAGEPRFSVPDFAIVRTCDPDANVNGLELARQVIDKYDIPTLNRPEKILGTRRDTLYQRFANFEGIVVPKTIRIAPMFCKDVRDFLAKGEVRLPCIFRPAGGHNSRGVFLIRTLDDTDKLEHFAFDGREYYVSELYDCRDGDGYYRKFRVVYVDGRIYPRHLFVSESWCVDSKTKISEEKFVAEELSFLENVYDYIGAETMSKLDSFCKGIGLDIFGLDLNLRPDGTIVVFEANACMSFFYSRQPERYGRYINTISAATRGMLLRFYQSVKKAS